jgi:hypothetical protein
VELTRFLVVDVDWTQPLRALTVFDSGDLGLSTLNGQSGIYGRDRSEYHYKLGMTSVALLARSHLGRVSFLGGAGLGHYDLDTRSIRSRTGCTGPWVVACESPSSNGEFNFDRSGTALIVTGGIDVNVLPRVNAFVSGRIGGSNGPEEAAIAVGVRTALVPDRSRRARMDSAAARSVSPFGNVRTGDKIWIVYDDDREDTGTLLDISQSHVTIRTAGKVITAPLAGVRTLAAPDSVLNGFLLGAAAGAGVGAYLMYFDEPRTMPAAILAGGAVGAFLDALFSTRRVVYRKATSVRVTPAVTPSSARVGVNIAWR